MNIYQQPDKQQLFEILQRPAANLKQLEEPVKAILEEVRRRGDEAVKSYTKLFDQVELENVMVSQVDIEEAVQQVSPQLKAAIQTAYQNIYRFHKAQDQGGAAIETMPGVLCWRKNKPINKVGLYIPGGTAPLFSTVLMLGIPAQIAGCKEVMMCTPPQKDGSVNPAILYAAQLTGIQKIYKIGGVQAIGAMAYGTETVEAVYKIFGPGNAYVTIAKQIVSQEGIAIDMPAGPSEVMVVADETAYPNFVAADLLSQAEHGTDSQVILVAYSKDFVQEVLAEIEKQVQSLPRQEIARACLQNSVAIVVNEEAEALNIINAYAPEHLIIATKTANQLADQVENAGSIFIGNYTPESAGDYASGTNHTLPTNGFARAYSGVSLDSFVKKITYQQITPEGMQQLGPTVVTMAEAEQLQAHANAVNIRLQSLNPPIPQSLNPSISSLVRSNILHLKPYSSARKEYKGTARVFLDANENPFSNNLNRYPDPLQEQLKQVIATQKGVNVDNIFLGNGSDEAIDLLMRIFCEPQQDSIITLPPTYGMYQVSADIANIAIKEVPLKGNFEPDVEAILRQDSPNTKLLFICSPNNPTGNQMPLESIILLVEGFTGIVVIDEAYIDFAKGASCIELLEKYNNIVILQTFSKAWGLAGIRLGMAYANPSIIELLNKVKPPYNVNQLTQQVALKALQEKEKVQTQIATIKEQRKYLENELNTLPFVQKVYPSDANFLLVKMDHPLAIYNYLLTQEVIVRNRSTQFLCEGCLRITVGTPKENEELVRILKTMNVNSQETNVQLQEIVTVTNKLKP